MSMKTLKLVLFAVTLCSPVYAAENAAKKADSEDMVVATVNGKKIMISDVVKLHDAHPQISLLPLKDTYRPILENLINVTVVSEAAKKDGLKKDPEVKQMMQDVENQVISRVYLERRVKAMQTKEAMKQMYEQYKKDNPPQESMSASHILVKTESEAKDVIKKLQNGADFADMANKVSENKGLEGGDLGFFTREDMVPEFSEAAFNMKEGEISKVPVKTQFGYHIIKAGPRMMKEVPNFDDVEKELSQHFMTTSYEKVVNDLRQKASVKEMPVQFDAKGNVLK